MSEGITTPKHRNLEREVDHLEADQMTLDMAMAALKTAEFALNQLKRRAQN